jgi:hypothetical protein
MEHGKARVSSTTSRLACDARSIVRNSPDGTTKISALELVKKVAFDGD